MIRTIRQYNEYVFIEFIITDFLFKNFTSK